jgi:acetyl esterase/lipase
MLAFERSGFRPTTVVLAPNDIEGWRQRQEAYEKGQVARNHAQLAKLKFSQRTRSINGTPVIEIVPANIGKSTAVLVYVHGGGYVLGSAQSSLATAAAIATDMRARVVSIDYTLAPHARWQKITDEVVAVLRGLQAEGHPFSSIAMIGDSAGGSLTAGAVLKMRDQTGAMPAALVLRSPWSDITESGDSYATLKAADFLRYETGLKPGAAAYADAADQKNPYVSPVYGDYTKAYPPTLIQGGTREIFLSNFIRHYQALDSAGRKVKLDLYEGMPHVFQEYFVGTPEYTLAARKMRHFLGEHVAGMLP